VNVSHFQSRPTVSARFAVDCFSWSAVQAASKATYFDGPADNRIWMDSSGRRGRRAGRRGPREEGAADSFAPGSDV